MTTKPYYDVFSRGHTLDSKMDVSFHTNKHWCFFPRNQRFPPEWSGSFNPHPKQNPNVHTTKPPQTPIFSGLKKNMPQKKPKKTAPNFKGDPGIFFQRSDDGTGLPWWNFHRKVSRVPALIGNLSISVLLTDQRYWPLEKLFFLAMIFFEVEETFFRSADILKQKIGEIIVYCWVGESMIFC